jgi:hypothetical protein
MLMYMDVSITYCYFIHAFTNTYSLTYAKTHKDTYAKSTRTYIHTYKDSAH